MGSITHTKVTGAPADPNAIVDGPAWDATHTFSLTSADVGLGNVPNIDATNADNITGGSQTGTGALVRASAIAASGKPFFIFATGQSFLTQTPALVWTPESNVKVWNWDGVDTHVGTAFVAPSSTTINLATKMASDIARSNPTRTVYLFNISYTGLAISHWLSGTGAPDMLVNIQNNISAALTAAGCTQADLGLWAQGQGDCGPINTSYVANHATWMGRLWADTTPGHIWFPKETPLIICSIQSVADSNSLNADADNMNILLNAVTNADPDKRRYCYLSSFAGSTYWDLTAHPTAQGHLSIGAMLASEYLNGTGRNTLQNMTVAPATGNAMFGNPAFSTAPRGVSQNTFPKAIAPPSGTVDHAIGANGSGTFYTLDSFGGSGNAFIGRFAGGTMASPTATPADSLLIALDSETFDGTGSTFGAVNGAFQIYANGLQSGTNHGTYALLYLTPLNSTTVGQAYRFDVGGFTINGATSGGVKIAVPAVAGSNTLTLPAGTTDFSATGGAHKFVAQTTAGGALTVVQPADNDIASIYFSASLSANQSPITNSTFTKVNVNTVLVDSNSFYDNATNFRFQPTVAGKYLVRGVVCGAGTTITEVDSEIRKNGTTYARALNLAAGAGTTSMIEIVVSFNGSTDFVELWGNIIGTGTLSFLGGTAPIRTWFEARFMGP